MFLMHQNINSDGGGAERRYFFENQNWICKTYNLNLLIDGKSNISRRLRKIDSIAKIINLKIEWEFGEKTLTRYTEKLVKTRCAPTKCDSRKIANIISEAHRIDLIHGDINKKNIIIHEYGVALSDWEPSLIQIKNGKMTLMATYPYIDPDDLNQKKITKKTDLFSLACYFTSISEGNYYLMRNLAIKKPEVIKNVVLKNPIDRLYDLSLSDFAL